MEISLLLIHSILNLLWTEIHSLTCSDRFQATGVNFSASVLSANQTF